MFKQISFAQFLTVFLLLTTLNAASVVSAAGPTVTVTVSASDADQDVLSYRWKSTDGTVQEVNAATTTWILPDGPGLHFLYVQIADGKGGYIERRIAANTDTIGTPLPVKPPVVIAPPAPSAPGEVFWHIIYDIGFDGRRYYEPDVQVFLQDTISGQNYTAVTDLNGFFVTPKLPAGTYNLNYLDQFGATNISTDFDTLTVPQTTTGLYPVSYNGSDPYSGVGNDIVVPDPQLSPSQLFVGHVNLTDGLQCGTRSAFFNSEVTAMASLVTTAGAPLAGPVRVNAHGDYWLTADLTGVPEVKVRVTCEGAPLIDEVITGEVFSVGGNIEITRNITIPNHAPTIATMTASVNGSPTGAFLPPPSGLPSDGHAAPDAFLAFKGSDSRKGACQYYYAVGAVEGCDVNGNPTGATQTIDGWKRAHQMAPYNTSNVEYSATYINKVDLNLTRNHHGTVIAADHVAAYVCNHLGPTDAQGRPVEAQLAVNAAIDNAVNGKNLVACVAFDYSVTPGLNNNLPFTKYLTFGPSGDLLLSVNLDGRAEKFMPGVCVACHGADNYHVRYPEDGSGDANIGAHFLPYDLDNFAFSNQPGLTEVDQQAALKQLNQIVLATNPTAATSDLINGWYQAGTDAPDKNYVPPTWQAGTATDIDFYKRVIAPNCRTCHVALDPQFNFDDYLIFTSQNWMDTAICGDGSLQRAHSMPNSLVTFNRFWNSAGTANDQPAAYVDWSVSTYGPDVYSSLAACSKSFLPGGVFKKTAKRDFSGSNRSAFLWQKGNVYNAWFVNPDGLTRSSAGTIANLNAKLGTIAGTGDFDGDGKEDVLIQENAIYTVRLMNGRAIKVQARVANHSATGWTFSAIGDFNGDGKDDILWRKGDRYYLSLMNGTKHLPFVLVANRTGSGWTFAGTSDFNTDGMSDILWRNGDRYAVWFFNGTTVAGKVSVANMTGRGYAFIDTWSAGEAGLWQNASTYWTSTVLPRVSFLHRIENYTGTPNTFADTGDFNGDGQTDFVWRNGDVYNIRLYNYNTRLGSGRVANFTGKGWVLAP